LGMGTNAGRRAALCMAYRPWTLLSLREEHYGGDKNPKGDRGSLTYPDIVQGIVQVMHLENIEGGYCMVVHLFE
jgi:hypothetical protein